VHSGKVPIETVRVSTFVVPTDGLESDGTLLWDRTTVVLVEVAGGGQVGLGWTYADKGTADVVREKLVAVVQGANAMAIPELWASMSTAIRNLGRPGVASMAMAAVDAAVWDLKAKVLGLPLVTLLGARRECAPAYGSGGFTSYDDAKLAEQLGGWVAAGFSRVKMKVGREPDCDVHRVRVARQAIGDASLFVDANGAYTRTQALKLADVFRELGVVWFEEPVTSDDLEGLRLLRDRAPGGMDIAAGEYGYDLHYFRQMLGALAVDVLQADATRCGISNFLRTDALCEASARPSRPTAPRRSTPTSRARASASFTSNTSTITRASSRCSSTGPPFLARARSGPISPVLASVSSSEGPTRSASPPNATQRSLGRR
jgi:L-alanine-DL-glutamate epimerase-like enolase superfamily enzyme